MKATAYICLLFSACVLCLSCDSTIYLDLDADPVVDRGLISELLSVPLPKGIAFSDGPPDESRISIVVAMTNWEKSLPPEVDGAPGNKRLRRTWYAPVAPNIGDVIAEKDLGAGTKVKMLPLGEIILPTRGLSVDGEYPGDPGYPYFEDTVIYIAVEGKQSPDEKILALLNDWIEQLPRTIDNPEITWVAAVGDMMPGRGVSRLLARKNGLDTVFADTLPVLLRGDVTTGNLEGAVTSRGIRIKKSYSFRFNPAVLDSLERAGFDYLSITNNHSYDFGETGFMDTITHLARAGIATSGAGIDLVSASAPAVFNHEGGEIRVLSIGAYPPEKNGFDGEEITSAGDDRPGILWANDRGLAAVEAAFSDTSFDVLLVHGGVEWSTAPSKEQRELFRHFVNLGADAVIGSHPHVLQGLEVYNEGLIAYSLGNFIFPGMDETAYGEESVILLLGISDHKVRYVEMVPVAIDGTMLSIDTSGKILSRILERTRRLK
jgi:poly-gamma-glutamate capsule biosynthesis protein CapA/YwtB (metallophosphatase superfamily)